MYICLYAVYNSVLAHCFSYKFAILCFFGGEGCNYVPGLRGVVFIAMYVLSYIGGGLLLRYAEGATYLAVVQVRTTLRLRFKGGQTWILQLQSNVHIWALWLIS